MAFFGFMPFILEIGVLFAACTKFKVIDNVENIQRRKEEEAKARRQEYMRVE